MADEKEKTGGTKNKGRMAPGEEGRGGARRQRRPELPGGAAKGDLKKLQDQALSVADFLGHDCEVWRLEKSSDVGQIRCRVCDLRAGFALNPMSERVPHPDNPKKTIMQQKDKINGPCVTEKCSA